MSNGTRDNLLSRLAAGGQDDQDQTWNSLAATTPKHAVAGNREEQNLDDVMARIAQLVGDESVVRERREAVPSNGRKAASPPGRPPTPTLDDPWVPLEPRSFREAGITDTQVESLILKYLLNVGSATGREVSDQVRLPLTMLQDLLRQMKHDQLLVYKDAAALGDYVYQLTELGRERARRHSAQCTYFGAAPVALRDYVASVAAQSITLQRPTEEQLRDAFRDLLVSDRMLERLGPAINSGRGLFLYGAPGNGKTSIAERVTRAFGQAVWVPRAIGVEGEIIRLFDPSNHEMAPLEDPDGLIDDRHIDHRWVRIKRPTIVVGGELTMEQLEVSLNPSTRICEAPIQLKSNTGTLVIDDFGRQRMRVDELLNRWIVPLEKRYDFLNLPNGKKIQVPFDQLIVFSTNLEPKQLVDDAFLRRIPYKIEVADPNEQEFRRLMRIMADQLQIPYNDEAVTYLLEKHYRSCSRPLRCCHPRDLLMQIRNMCSYKNREPQMTPAMFDLAVSTYFAVL